MARLFSTRRAVAGCLLVLVTAGVARAGERRAEAPVPLIKPSVAPAAAPAAPKPPPVARKAASTLPKIDYTHVPTGFPADPDPGSLAMLGAALHPERKLAVYDAPGGVPRAYLPRDISGLPVIVPIVRSRPGWVAVLLPSVNRRIGWLPATGWTRRALHDQLVLHRDRHELIWLRDGRERQRWTVAVGTKRTPTPLGRTFVLGRTGTHGSVYAGLDALVLAAVPENRDALAPGLRDAHTGIHGWSRTSAFGHSVSNGCIRLPASAQRTLLHNLGAGTTVHVVDAR